MLERKEVYPALKPIDQGTPTSGIYFDEDIVLPDGSSARITLVFDRGNSFEEMVELISILKEKRLKFIIEPA